MGRERTITAVASSLGTYEDLAGFVLAEAVNELEVRQAAISGVTALASLPPAFYKYRGKPVINAVKKAAKNSRIPLLGVKAEMNPALRVPMVSVTAVGVSGEVRKLEAGPGLCIVMAGSAGQNGALRVLLEKEAVLKERFVPAFIQPVYRAKERLSVSEIVRIADTREVYTMCQAGAGGVFAALWDIADTASTGFDIDLKHILICQETIEICEYLRLNPYQLNSAGTVLMLAKDGEALVKCLEEQNIQAAMLGHTTEGNGRIIRNGGEQRFLDKPAPDELVKIFYNESKEGGRQ